jgi:hypothetical protein
MVRVRNATVYLLRSRASRLILIGLVLGAVSFAIFGGAGHGAAGSNPLPVALERPATASDALPSAVAQQMRSLGYDTASSREVAPGVFLLSRSDGMLCSVTFGGPSDPIGSGCQSATDFFAGNPIVFGVSEHGSPASPSDIRIAGVAQPDVTEVRLAVGDSVANANPTSDGGFVLQMSGSAVPASSDASLGSLQALGHDGKVLASYSLPSR